MQRWRLTAPGRTCRVSSILSPDRYSQMFGVGSLWIPFTITAALGQVARNAMRRHLTGPVGTWGATNIRFLFGFPFSILFFAVVMAATGDSVPWPPAAFWPWLLLGALSQIVATGLMLLAMNDRSFVVTTAYLKTEAIQTAIFGFIFLGDHLTLPKVLAILIATVGVVITALRPGGEKSFAELKPTIIGLGAAAAFALSAVGFRGAIIAVPGVSFVTAASFTLVLGLFAQTLILSIYLLWRAPKVLRAILGLWKPALRAGFVGKALADIVGVLHDVIAQFFELGAQFLLLRHHQRRRSRRRSFRRRDSGVRRRRCASAALFADDAWRHDRLLDLGRAAGRA